MVKFVELIVDDSYERLSEQLKRTGKLVISGKDVLSITEITHEEPARCKSCGEPLEPGWPNALCGGCIMKREEAAPASPSPLERDFECKHCKTTFTRWVEDTEVCAGCGAPKEEANSSPFPSPLCPICGTEPEYTYPFQVAGNPPETVELGHCSKCDKDFEL